MTIKLSLILLCINLLHRTYCNEIVTNPQQQTWHIGDGNKALSCGYKITDRTLQKPSVSWYKNGVALNARLVQQGIPQRLRIYTRRMRNDYISTSLLIFKNVVENDAGMYKCGVRFASGKLESDVADIKVRTDLSGNIQYGEPIITQGPPKHYNINPGSTALNVPCQFEGNPPVVKIVWEYIEVNGEPPVNGKKSDTILRPLDNPNLISIPHMNTARKRGVELYKVFCKITNVREQSVRSVESMLIFKDIPQSPTIDMTQVEKRSAKMSWKINRTPLDGGLTCDVTVASSALGGFTQTLEIGSSSGGIHSFNTLRPFTTYSVKMRCVNEQGPSEWSDVVSFTTSSDVPTEPPQNIDLYIVNSTTLRVSWEDISEEDVNGKLVGYGIKCFIESNAIPILKKVLPTEHNVTFYNLIPGTTYFVKVAGITEAGQGRYSQPDRISLPKSQESLLPSIGKIDADEDYVKITFKNVSDTIDCVIQVTKESSGDTHEVRIVGLSQTTVKGLQTFTKYYARVKCGQQWGQLRHFQTKEGTPTASPIIINASNTAENEIVLIWEDVDPSKMNGILRGYFICTGGKMRDSYDECDFEESNDKSIIYIEGVMPSTTYSITMSACSGPTTCGPPSPAVLHTTLAFEYDDPRDGLPVSATIGIVISLVFMLILILFLGYCYGKYKEKKLQRQRNSANGLTVAYTAGASGQAVAQYQDVPGSSNSRAVSPNLYTPAYLRPSNLSTEIMKKVFGVRIPRSALVMKDILGEGEFGSVYKAILKTYDADSGELEVRIPLSVAVKSLKLETAESNDQEEFISEGLRMKDLNHPNVMHLVGVCLPGIRKSVASNPSSLKSNRSDIQLVSQSEMSPLVVLPYLPNGSLRQHLFDARTEGRMNNFTSYRLLKFASDTSEGMAYLADKNIIHRDLAARNCLLDENFRVVVSDFGLSRKTYYESYYRQKHSAKMPVKWMAIESLEDRIYTEKTDVWSFGVTFWEILTFCQNPYPGVSNHELCALLKNGNRLTKPLMVPDDVWRLVLSCWDESTEERPSFVCIKNKMQELLLTYSAKEFCEDEKLYVNVTTRPKSEYVEPIPAPPVRGSSAQKQGNISPEKQSRRSKQPSLPSHSGTGHSSPPSRSRKRGQSHPEPQPPNGQDHSDHQPRNGHASSQRPAVAPRPKKRGSGPDSQRRLLSRSDDEQFV